MKIKRFYQINEGSDSKLDNFYREYKKLFDDQYEAEEGEEWGDGELATEVGQLITKYNLQKDDLKTIIDNYDTRFDYLSTLEWEYKEWDDDPIADKWNVLLDFIEKNKNLDRNSLINRLRNSFDTPWERR